MGMSKYKPQSLEIKQGPKLSTVVSNHFKLDVRYLEDNTLLAAVKLINSLLGIVDGDDETTKANPF